jgi:hypothetical protein
VSCSTYVCSYLKKRQQPYKPFWISLRNGSHRFVPSPTKVGKDVECFGYSESICHIARIQALQVPVQNIDVS